MPKPAGAMLDVRDLAYQYPDSVVMAFPDFGVAAGEALLICGESGCGKTTLLHCLAGLLRPAQGRVSINGVAISDRSPSQLDSFRGKHIGLVFQQAYFIESLTVRDNLLLSPYAGSASRAEAVADRLGIADFLDRYPRQLSAGQQQRVSIARAVMNEPRVLLADEPTSALDHANCREVIRLLKEEGAANDAALIIVTHDDRLKSELRDRIELAPLARKSAWV